MKKILAIAMMALMLTEAEAQPTMEAFQNPPQEARAQVWWHWMNGNITHDGIHKDLTWMKQIGLGGFHHFDAAMTFVPTMVDKRLIYMQDDWKQAFRYAIEQADSLGLEVSVASAPGWSATGGPWVKPENAMKKLVWRELVVTGGRRIDMQLPAPYTCCGPYQNIPAGTDIYGIQNTSPEHYEDITLLAVRLPEGERLMSDLKPTITANGGSFSLELLTDGDPTTAQLLPNGADGHCWLQYEFREPQTIRSLRIAIAPVSANIYGSNAGMRVLEVSQDGVNFEKVTEFGDGRLTMQTLSIPATTGRYFRLTIENPKAAPAMWGMPAAPAPEATPIAEFALSTASLVNKSEDKAGFSALDGLWNYPTPSSPDEQFAQTQNVIDITAQMDAQGRLQWKAPKGRWRIIRLGFSLTGKTNHPAPAEATGLEVDKLDLKAYADYITHYLDMYQEASGGALGKVINYLLTDSYEADQENWTPRMFEEFRERRGYDLKPWLPALTGMVIGSPEQTDAFLRDWRQTIGDLLAANYDQLTTITQQRYGMKGRYAESHEAGRAFVVDGMDVKRTSQIPMSAMWMPGPHSGDASQYIGDLRESGSVAHIYGQNIAAAESFTAYGNGYGYVPQMLKPTADRMMKHGINRFVIHESAHQPLDDKVPGYSLMSTGQWFNRHETWAPMAGAWINYLSRSGYMLQQGRNVADVLIYYGEDSNVGSLYRGSLPEVPNGYEYDFINPSGLLRDIQGCDGRLVVPSGATYRMLWLDRNMKYMSLAVLRKLAELARQGILIAGEKPQNPFGIMDDGEEFQRLVCETWSLPNVITGVALANVLRQQGIVPDFKCEDAAVSYLHRTLEDGEIYWVSRQGDDYKTITVACHTSGRKPQIWNPVTGMVEDGTYRMADGYTYVTLEMVPQDALFIVFGDKTTEHSFTKPSATESNVLTIDGPWQVAFQAHRGAPTEATFPSLVSFSENNDRGIKYFSGIATYRNSFRLKKLQPSLMLDLGEVCDVAEVIVNGQPMGTLWKQPFRLDISSAVKKGENTIEIRVANRWVNRLIGDVQPDCTERITWVDMPVPYYQPDAPLLNSGLLGPVKITKKDITK